MIQMFHVTKRYDGRITALQDVSLHVQKGEFAFLVGPTGAGKTTLLRLVYCAEKPDEGQILVAGWNVARLKARSIPYLRRHIGVVFQDFKLVPRKTVFENVALALRVAGHHPREIQRRVAVTLKRVGLDDHMNAMPRHLSGGEQQRVAIARALVNEPTILLADEPTGNLDADTAQDILRLFREANARGTTVLIATHNRDLLREGRSRVLVLEKGRLVRGGMAW